MKYSREQLRNMATLALRANWMNDPRYDLLIARLRLRTRLTEGKIVAKLTVLAQ